MFQIDGEVFSRGECVDVFEMKNKKQYFINLSTQHFPCLSKRRDSVMLDRSEECLVCAIMNSTGNEILCCRQLGAFH